MAGAALPGTPARPGRACPCPCCRPLLPATLVVPPGLPPAAAAAASAAPAACIRSRSTEPTASCGVLRMPTQKKGCCSACTAEGRRRGSHWHMAVIKSMASGLAVGTSFSSGCAGICGKRKPICKAEAGGHGMRLYPCCSLAKRCHLLTDAAHGIGYFATRRPCIHLLRELQALGPGSSRGCAHHATDLVELIRLQREGADDSSVCRPAWLKATWPPFACSLCDMRLCSR